MVVKIIASDWTHKCDLVVLRLTNMADLKQSLTLTLVMMTSIGLLKKVQVVMLKRLSIFNHWVNFFDKW